ncbi:lactate utilization protein B/C [Pararcticibacter amylolyticus]|uniref:Lactate utilization protein B/C n=2 Tax=Pararcticibacter amylolyticus TaxID=2173175 RepID=A0A2U2PCC2_9SPHI|nr:lactate utilization protein B/C [Pararcticibacter amylolyticus]
MTSREKILAAVAANQPSLVPLPELNIPPVSQVGKVEKFISVATAIGSRVFEVKDFEELKENIAKLFLSPGRAVSSFTELSDIAETEIPDPDPHSLQDVNLAVLKAELGVAENGSMWVPETNMIQRILPFITQHLVLVLEKTKIINTMHEAYQMPETQNPGFGAFIAGPSKTADIEQSLVLGAHGPRSMTIFLM